MGLKRPIDILIEVGVDGTRTGVRNVEDALLLARFAQRDDALAIVGVATFEGVVRGSSDVEMEPYVESLFDTVREVAEALADDRLFHTNTEIILSAGGSRFFDIAAARLKDIDIGWPTIIVLRSGCYITQDAHHYEKAFQRLLARGTFPPIAGRLESAIEVWADVQSRPEPTRAFANIGKRDVSYDMELPSVVKMRSGLTGTLQDPVEIAVEKLSDQHVHLIVPETSEIAFGDRLAFGISHPCTTFDKWKYLFEVDDDDVVIDVIATFF